MPLARVLLHLRILGPRPPRGPGPLILAPNHQSWIDPLLVQAAVYPRRITFLMTELFYDLPVARWYFRAAAARPIRESGPSVAALRASLEALEAGETICLFPEGAITPDGRLQPGRRGVARLAARSGAPVLPLGIRGAVRVFSKVQKLPRIHPVEVRIGEPMRYQGEDSREGEEAFTAELMSRIETLAYGRGEPDRAERRIR